MEVTFIYLVALTSLVSGSDFDPDQKAMYPDCGTRVPLKDVSVQRRYNDIVVVKLMLF